MGRRASAPFFTSPPTTRPPPSRDDARRSIIDRVSGPISKRITLVLAISINISRVFSPSSKLTVKSPTVLLLSSEDARSTPTPAPVIRGALVLAACSSWVWSAPRLRSRGVLPRARDSRAGAEEDLRSRRSIFDTCRGRGRHPSADARWFIYSGRCTPKSGV